MAPHERLRIEELAKRTREHVVVARRERADEVAARAIVGETLGEEGDVAGAESGDCAGVR